MKMKQLIGICGALVLAACNADIEPVDQHFVGPDGQDPAAYAAYVATLRSYKQSDHYMVCARFDNATETIASEKECLRSLPDSLDLVALRNPLSKFDREDLPTLQQKGTRVVLYADCSDPATAVQRVDETLAAIAADGLDGIVVAFTGPMTATAQTAAQAVAAKIATLDATILFEGNVAFVATADRDKYDFYILDASQTATVFTLRSDIAYLTGFHGIPAAKILPAVKPFGVINDREGLAQDAVKLVPEEATALGLGGVTLYDASTDYYSALGTYSRIRSVIDLLNPAHEK